MLESARRPRGTPGAPAPATTNMKTLASAPESTFIPHDRLREAFGALTEADLARIESHPDEMVEIIAARTGQTRDDVDCTVRVIRFTL